MKTFILIIATAAFCTIAHADNKPNSRNDADSLFEASVRLFNKDCFMAAGNMFSMIYNHHPGSGLAKRSQTYLDKIKDRMKALLMSRLTKVSLTTDTITHDYWRYRIRYDENSSLIFSDSNQFSIHYPAFHFGGDETFARITSKETGKVWNCKISDRSYCDEILVTVSEVKANAEGSFITLNPETYITSSLAGKEFLFVRIPKLKYE